MYRITFKKAPETGKSLKVLVPVTSEEEYRADRDSVRNLNTLTKVHTYYEDYFRQASEGADAKTLKKYKDEMVDPEKSHLVQYVYSCVPEADMRLKGCTKVTPWVGMDVDFDATDPDREQKMEEAPAKIIAMAQELGLGMLERSAGKGYHLVFRRHLDLTQEENLKWASDLIGCKYDENAKDITRVFFTTSASPEDLLFLSPELFTPESNQPVELEVSQTATQAPAMETTQTQASPQQAGQTVTANPAAYSYLDYTFQEIIDKYWKLYNDGQTPTDGNRNSLTYELALNLRCICDYSTERLIAIIPCYDGLSDEERKKAIASANSQPAKGMTYRMRKVLEALKKEKKDNSLPWGLSAAIPPKYTGRMPEPLRKITDITPDHLKSTVSEGVFGALSTHLHGVRFVSDDGSELEPAIMQILIFRQSRGKGSIDKPIECINEDLEAHDIIDRQREQEWKQNNPTDGSGKKKKKEPRPTDLYIQVCQSDMTNAAFVQRLIDANNNGERPIFIQMQELDEIYALITNGKKDVSRIIRKAFDRKKYGQERVGADSVTGQAPLRLNFTAATTPIKAQEICSPWVNDGTISRCNLLTIDEGPKPKYKPVTPKYKKALAPYIARLNNAHGLIRCKKAEQLAERMQAMLDDEYAATDCEALNTFASRAITIAYFKAMILYIMQGKWTKDIEEYVIWSLQRDIWVKLHYFGKKMENELEEENNLQTFHPKSILDILPNTFSEEDFIKARQQLGLKGNYKEHLKKLKQRGQIAFDETIGMYVKIQDNKQS